MVNKKLEKAIEFMRINNCSECVAISGYKKKEALDRYTTGNHEIMCVFCNKENIKSDVTEIDNCYVFEPLNPVVKGHLLVVNKRHTKDFTSDADVFAETCKVASDVAFNIGGDFGIAISMQSLGFPNKNPNSRNASEKPLQILSVFQQQKTKFADTVA